MRFITAISLMYHLTSLDLISGLDQNLTLTADMQNGFQHLKQQLQSGTIPSRLIPFLNSTAIDEGKLANNGSLEFIVENEKPTKSEEKTTENAAPPVLNINQMTHDGNKTIVKISEEATYNLIQKWVDQAASGLLMALMSIKIRDKRLRPHHISQHNNCTNEATSISEHAQCVVAILKRLDEHRRKLRKTKKLKLRRSLFNRARRAKRDLTQINTEEQGMTIQKRRTYELKEKREMSSPLSLVAKTLTNLVREKKKKEKEPEKR